MKSSTMTPARTFNDEQRARWNGIDGEYWTHQNERLDRTLARRVERRNFTRELSQIRTRRSPVIRLVPPSEGWRLPPQPQGSSHIRLATIKGSWSGWPVPLAPRALPRFNATTEQSIPDVSIATFRLGGLSPCTFSLNISRQVLTFPSEA